MKSPPQVLDGCGISLNVFQLIIFTNVLVPGSINDSLGSGWNPLLYNIPIIAKLIYIQYTYTIYIKQLSTIFNKIVKVEAEKDNQNF